MTNDYRKIYCRHLHTREGMMKVAGPTKSGKDAVDSFMVAHISTSEIAFRTQSFMFDPPDGFPKNQKRIGKLKGPDHGTLVAYIITDSVTADFSGLLHYPVSNTELREYKNKIGWTEL